jgi:oligoendopeptidase F
MSITQLAFQAVIAQNLIEENDYKVHNLEVTNELTGKTIDNIWDEINRDSGGDIVERIEYLENKTRNIT